MPTPISALIHAATMVTAGVFLLLRLNQLISVSYYVIITIVIIGGLTAFIGGTLALVSLDLKELIAYSTMSQLGYCLIITIKRFISKIPNKDNKNFNFVDILDPNILSKYQIKSKYKGIPLIINFIYDHEKTGKFYVGKTTNSWYRFQNYFNYNYINKNKDSMPICNALHKYGLLSFKIYILETFHKDISLETLC